MKLFFCPSCHDVQRLMGNPRNCFCGASGARYNGDGDTATVWGRAKLIGLVNTFFTNDTPTAIAKAIERGYASHCFWYPEDNGKITRLEKQP